MRSLPPSYTPAGNGVHCSPIPPLLPPSLARFLLLAPSLAASLPCSFLPLLTVPLAHAPSLGFFTRTHSRACDDVDNMAGHFGRLCCPGDVGTAKGGAGLDKLAQRAEKELLPLLLRLSRSAGKNDGTLAALGRAHKKDVAEYGSFRRDVAQRYPDAFEAGVADPSAMLPPDLASKLRLKSARIQTREKELLDDVRACRAGRVAKMREARATFLAVQIKFFADATVVLQLHDADADVDHLHGDDGDGDGGGGCDDTGDVDHGGAAGGAAERAGSRGSGGGGGGGEAKQQGTSAEQGTRRSTSSAVLFSDPVADDDGGRRGIVAIASVVADVASAQPPLSSTTAARGNGGVKTAAGNARPAQPGAGSSGSGGGGQQQLLLLSGLRGIVEYYASGAAGHPACTSSFRRTLVPYLGLADWAHLICAGAWVAPTLFELCGTSSSPPSSSGDGSDRTEDGAVSSAVVMLLPYLAPVAHHDRCRHALWMELCRRRWTVPLPSPPPLDEGSAEQPAGEGPISTTQRVSGLILPQQYRAWWLEAGTAGSGGGPGDGGSGDGGGSDGGGGRREGVEGGKSSGRQTWVDQIEEDITRTFGTLSFASTDADGKLAKLGETEEAGAGGGDDAHTGNDAQPISGMGGDGGNVAAILAMVQMDAEKELRACLEPVLGAGTANSIVSRLRRNILRGRGSSAGGSSSSVGGGGGGGGGGRGGGGAEQQAMVQLVTSKAKLEATLRRTPPFDLGIDPFEGQLRDILLRTEEASVRRDDRNDEATKEVVQRGKEAMLLDLCSSHERGKGRGSGQATVGSSPVEAEGARQGQLRRILLAYGAKNGAVEYCQGMNFVGRLLLDECDGDEVAAFTMMCVVCECCGMKDVWAPGMKLLALRFFQLERLMVRHLPVLVDHLATNHITISMFASSWFLTIFTNLDTLPSASSRRVFELFLLHGWSALMSAALAVLDRLSVALLQRDFEGMLRLLQVTLGGGAV